ncbi:MAG: SUMF1/EgtB/PvdO family nonheme iron enzyme [Thiohalocapsa sp.]|uniref:SUMF1/EgtB/PvdO family nonheme iron enzyme n=1 Tax=Thiohalocapsa sp. TaxID=2497641 RepID=UPI0025EB8BFF|nr:SUMF1/EgtB/PvdO family nonheme iron enzyme [Thiohalocapsa sp.]MCG6942469.1 SUMF1/EgtB/PvdO family nonheme iron enzyme [Thiohalocapsa sp.]
MLTLLVALGLERAGHDDAEFPLPADRAALLDEATRLFLRRWLERIERDAPKQIPVQIAEELSREGLREALQHLSLEVQRVRPETTGGADVQVEVSEIQFLGAVLTALPQPLHARAVEFRRLILERAGILFDRGGAGDDGRYGYVHRLFQEYLAACELVARHHADLERALGEPLRASPGAWREVARFVPVHLAAEHGPGQAIDLVIALLGDADAHSASTDRDYQAVAAVGQALVDLKAALADTALTPHQRDNLAGAKRRFDAWLLRGVDDAAPAPATRLDLGRIAGRLGDSRRGIVPAAWTADAAEPFSLDPERDFDWVRIPAVPFRPGSDQADLDRPDDDPAKAYPDELNPDPEPAWLSAFEIARYPVTQAQFAAFTRAGGYGAPGAKRPPEWWRYSDAAEAWWHGGNPGLEQYLADPAFPEDQKEPYRRWVEQRAASDRRRPWFLGDPRYADWVLPNHAVIGVSWFEAMAFCGWLTAQAAAAGEPWRYRLPSEIEWERAARGAERRRWPWGEHWQPGAANTEEAGLATVSAAGLFPTVFASELRDAAGNVWEWTETRWGPEIGEPAFGWPFDPDDDRDDPNGTDLRVVKGGSWWSTPRVCRGAYRYGGDPLNWGSYLGFRVVRVSLA